MTRRERIETCRALARDMSQLVQMASILADTFLEIAADSEKEEQREQTLARPDPRQAELRLVA